MESARGNQQFRKAWAQKKAQREEAQNSHPKGRDAMGSESSTSPGQCNPVGGKGGAAVKEEQSYTVYRDFYDAIESENLEAIELLLKSGEIDVNGRMAGYQDRTALQVVAGDGRLGVVKLLLQYGADVKVKPANGRDCTALQAASGSGHLEVVKLLLNHGADIEAKSGYDHRTALQAASSGGHLEVVKLLLNHGADVNANPASHKGLTALQAASSGGHLEVVELLLNHGANVNAEPAYSGGRTALQAASSGGHLEVVKLLLNHGADIETRSVFDGRTALQEASSYGHSAVVELLKHSAGVKIEPKLSRNHTVLQTASGSNYIEVPKLPKPRPLTTKGSILNKSSSLVRSYGGNEILDRVVNYDSIPTKVQARVGLDISSQSHVVDTGSIEVGSEATITKPTVLTKKEAPSLVSLKDLSDLRVTFWDRERRNFKRISKGERRELLRALKDKYQAISFTDSPPFIVIECSETLLESEQQPFFVAGLIAIFIKKGDILPKEIHIRGSRGSREDCEIPESIAMDLIPFKIPRLETFKFLYRSFFTDAISISYISRQLLVEFETRDQKVFEEKIKLLPLSIGSLVCGYMNGEAHLAPYGRKKNPEPHSIDGQIDDTDYIAELGQMYPGVVVRSKKLMSTSGIQIQRGDQKRITVASHTWPRDSGPHVYHGGQEVGIVEERIGNDIALAVITPFYTNSFLTSGQHAQKFIEFDEIEIMDQFEIDTPYTGRQILICTGRKTMLVKKEDSVDNESSDFIILDQGIFNTDTRHIPTLPVIRDGVCGAALLRTKVNNGCQKVDDGGVGGFMWLADGESEGRFECYCPTADPLIEGGWSVTTVMPRLKRSRDSEPEDNSKETSQRYAKRVAPMTLGGSERLDAVKGKEPERLDSNKGKEPER